MSEEYIKVGRVLIAFQIIFVPVYFFILAISFEPLPLPMFIPSIITEIFVSIIVPVVLSIPFVLFSYENKYQVSEAYEHMGDKIWRLPNSIKAFYGFNFFLVILFGLPFIGPLITFSGGYFIGLLIFGKKEDEVQISRPPIRLLTIIYLPFALLISLIFYSQIFDFFIELINNWLNNIDLLYFTALNIANAALIGGIILLVFKQIEQSDYGFERPLFVDNAIAFAVFLVLEVLLIYFYFGTENIGTLDANQQFIFSIINIAGFLLSLIVLVSRYFLQVDVSEEETSIFGWLTIFAFQAVNIASSGDFALFSRTIAIFITCGIFILLFFSSYREAARYI